MAIATSTVRWLSRRMATRLLLLTPNDRGMVELWAADLNSRRTRRVSNFSRDAYAPTVAADGTVVFKVQTYRTTLADVAFEGGPTRQLTTFQSETPSYHPTRPLIAFTYGTWRRVVDDAKYPDIAQEIGVVDIGQSLPATKPTEVLEDSDSEDQAMTWSPNGKWIAFHTHQRNVGRCVAEAGRRESGRQAHHVPGPRRGSRVAALVAGRTHGAARRRAQDRRRVGALHDWRQPGHRRGDVRSSGGQVDGIDGEMGHAEWLPGSA